MANFKYNMLYELEYPTIVLTTKYHKHLGIINTVDNSTIETNVNFNSSQEISFDVYKKLDDVECNLWEKIVDHKYIYVPEYDEYYSITISLDEDNKTVKHITGTSQCEYELSNRKLYNFECNTEEDVAREDYIPTKFYDPINKNGSLLNRILVDKCPDYTIKHVDTTLANIQRIFSTDGTDIYSFMTGDIAEEIGCLFEFNSARREISAYDLYQTCFDCGYRGDYINFCPKCKSTNISKPYGENTNVFISYENYAESITTTVDADNMFNCLRINGGDENVTATVRNINPNGTNYVYNFSDYDLDDMPTELVNKINSYNNLYEHLLNEQVFSLDRNIINKYNGVIDWINQYQTEQIPYKKIDNNIKGYNALTEAWYESIDFYGYINHSMMPTIPIPETDAEKEAQNLVLYLPNEKVAVQNIKSLSSASADIAVIGMAKVIANPVYKLEVINSTLTDSGNNKVWKGSIHVQNSGNEDDKADTTEITVTIIGDNYEQYLRQKIQKSLDKKDSTFLSIFEITDDNLFKQTLHKYGLSSLKNFLGSYNAVLEVMTEQGITNEESKELYNVDLYNKMYIPYYNHTIWIQDEMKLREEQIDSVEKANELLKTERENVQKQLNFRNYLGEDLYIIYTHYLREDDYTNDNFISDGKDNAELIELARELYDTAKDEVVKASIPQYELSSNVQNLLCDKEFEPFRDKIQCGNWITIKADEKNYRLRLIGISISYSSLNNVNVTFSSVTQFSGVMSDAQSILAQAGSMAGSYNYVTHQAQSGSKAQSSINQWIAEGLNSALVNIKNNDSEEITYDNHGLIAKSYDDILQGYTDEQVKLTHNCLVFTKDNWRSASAALGKHQYTYYNTATKSFQNNVDFGLSASFVQAGQINGTQIVGGDIYSDNYRETGTKQGTHIDLTNGAFSFAGGKFTYDGSQTINIGNKLVYNGSTLSLLGNFKVGTIFEADSDNNTVSIANFTVKNNALYSGTDSISDTKKGIYLGTNGIRNYEDKDHYVTIQNGVINALGVDLTGSITATSGTIGGCKIENGQLVIPQAYVTNLTTDIARIGTVEADIVKVNGDISTISGNITTINGSINTINGNINTINGNITAINGTVSGLRGEFNTLNAKAITTENFSAQSINADNITAGTLSISKLTWNGTFNSAQIPNLSASKITTGTLSADRIDSDSFDSKISNMSMVTIPSTLKYRTLNCQWKEITIGSVKYTVMTAVT